MPTSGTPLIDADAIDGAAPTSAVPLDVAIAEVPTPLVSAMVTEIESPASELCTVYVDDVAPAISVEPSYHWYVAVGAGVPVTPAAAAVSVSPTTAVPLIQAEAINGAAVTCAVPVEVADAAVPTPFVSVMVTEMESPASELWHRVLRR